ncbi:hypothetical protein RRG08_059718 [Elysia crispata]|uniref:Uncharacterized protein n=1 Tax=Elysia crispata TaxID=231223 RepID=A0AAE1D2C7_9GAST|nr:hypothetical protein RRG08_059718 [Elysia crispata]
MFLALNNPFLNSSRRRLSNIVTSYLRRGSDPKFPQGAMKDDLNKVSGYLRRGSGPEVPRSLRVLWKMTLIKSQGELKSTKCIFNTLTPRLLGVRAAIWPGCQSAPFYTRQPPFPAPLDDSFGPLTNKRQTTQTGARGHHPRLQELFNAGECFTHSRLLVPAPNSRETRLNSPKFSPEVQAEVISNIDERLTRLNIDFFAPVHAQMFTRVLTASFLSCPALIWNGSVPSMSPVHMLTALQIGRGRQFIGSPAGAGNSLITTRLGGYPVLIDELKR